MSKVASKAEALSTALSSDKASSCKSGSQHRSDSHASIKRTKEYVQDQAKLQANAQLHPSAVEEDLGPPPPPPAKLFQESMSQLPLYEIGAFDRGKDFKHYEFSNNIVDPETHIPGEQSEEALRQAPYPAGYESKPSQRVKLSPSISNRQNPYFTCVRPPDDLSHLPTHAYQHSDMQPAETAINIHSYPQVKPCAPTPHLNVPLGNSTPRANSGENQDVSNLIRFMARREIVSTGLLQFDDCPENYRA